MIPVKERLSSKLRKDALADVISDYYGGYYSYYRGGGLLRLAGVTFAPAERDAVRL